MKRKKFEWTGRLILIIFSLILVLSLIFFITKQTHKNTTEQLLTEYMNYINKHEYEKMYKMISKEHSSNISMEEFVKRNKNIYEGLETKDLSIKILNEKSNGKEISYLTSFNTLAGEVKFQNEVNFIKEKFEYKQLIETNSEILLKLIGDILDLSKIEVGSIDINRQKLNLCQLCDELYRSFQQRIKNPKVILKLINPYTKCVANFDKYRFMQIFTNFATNAIKYTP